MLCNLQTLTGMLNGIAANMAQCCCDTKNLIQATACATDKLILDTSHQAERTAATNQAALMATLCANQAAIMHEFCEARHHRDTIAADAAMRDQVALTKVAEERAFALSQKLQTSEIMSAIAAGNGNGHSVK